MTVRQHNLNPAERMVYAWLSGGPSRPAIAAGQPMKRLVYQDGAHPCLSAGTRLAAEAMTAKRLSIQSFSA